MGGERERERDHRTTLIVVLMYTLQALGDDVYSRLNLHLALQCSLMGSHYLILVLSAVDRDPQVMDEHCTIDISSTRH